MLQDDIFSIMTNTIDDNLQVLLDLDGESMFIDEKLGVWVKFEVKAAPTDLKRLHGIRYSLTMHDRSGQRILGFDNAHEIEYGKKNKVAAQRTYDHCHVDGKKDIKPYPYTTALKLLEDFWAAVDKKIEELKGEAK